MAGRPAELTDVIHGRRRSGLRLLAPLRYLSISHPDRVKYDFLIPAVVCVVIIAIFLFVKPPIALFGENGVLRYIRDTLMMAIPFSIGALATIAMASTPPLDRRPPGAELLLDGEVLTLKQFICRLLGYLTFVSIITLAGSIAADLLREQVMSWTECLPATLMLVRVSGVAVLSMLVSVLTVTVLWSLYFLTDVAARPGPSERR